MDHLSKSNGSAGTIQELRAQTLSNEFQKEVWEVWHKFQKAEEVLEPNDFYRTLALALMHMSAVVAVDSHLTDMQFLGMAKMLWDDVQAKAPRFS